MFYLILLNYGRIYYSKDDIVFNISPFRSWYLAIVQQVLHAKWYMRAHENGAHHL